MTDSSQSMEHKPVKPPKLAYKLKLSLLLGVPIAALMFFSSALVSEKRDVSLEMDEFNRASHLIGQLSDLVHEMQKERGYTSGFIVSKGALFKTELMKQRAATDEQLSLFLKNYSSMRRNVMHGGITENLDLAVVELKGLKEIRAEVDSLRNGFFDALKYYSNTNSRMLDAIADLSQLSTDRDISIHYRAYHHLQMIKEKAGLQRAVLTYAFGLGKFPPGQYGNFIAIAADESSSLKRFLSLAPPDIKEIYLKIVATPEAAKADGMRKIAIEKGVEGNFGIDAAHWSAMQTIKIDKINDVCDFFDERIREVVDARRAEAETSLRIYLLVNFAVITFALLMGALLFRNMAKRQDLEESLEKIIALTGAVSNISPVGHVIADSKGTIISANPAAEQMFGYSAGEMIGSSVKALTPSFKEDEYFKYIQDYLNFKKTGLPEKRNTIRAPKEVLAVKKNGEIFHNSLFIKEVPLANEDVFVGIMEDITDRRAAKIALTEAMENSNAIMNASNETLALIGEEGNFIAINEAGAKRLNSKPDDLAGKAIFQVLPLKLAMSRLEYFKQVARTGKPISFEDERDGRFIANSIYPVIDKNARVTRFALFAVDITERKKAEAEIINANRRYASLIDNIRVTVYLLSPAGQLTFISKPVALLTGRQPDDFLEKRVLWEDILAADDRGKYDDFRQSIFSNISANSLQYRVKRTDGTTAWVFDQCIPLLDDGGDVACFQGTIGDLTKLKEMEQMKEDFYHAVVHDLKSPITGIQLELDMLGDQIASFSAECSTKEPCQRTFSGYEASLKQKVADVGEGLSQLYLMILSLLKLGEIEEEKLELHYEPFAMNDLLGELEHDFRGRAAAKGLAIEFRNAFAGTVIADFKLLKRVLQNLVDNALKYSIANTAITVDAGCAKKGGSCENIIISVTNTGQPLTENKINALFQKFKTLGHAESGSGIGLFFCFKTMNLLGGGIYVDQDAETITFHIFFPNG